MHTLTCMQFYTHNDMPQKHGMTQLSSTSFLSGRDWHTIVLKYLYTHTHTHTRMQYVWITIVPDLLMSKAGDHSPCARCELISVGNLGETENVAISKTLCDFISSKLSIAYDR